MPQFEHDRASIHYEIVGEGKPLLLIAGIASDGASWGPLVPLLAGRRLILIDNRGCGQTRVEGPIEIAEMADDCAALLDHLGARSAIVCGVSVGGMVAQQLYRDRPDLVRALILCDTAGKMGDADFWNARIAAIEADGIESIADAIMERWFTPAFRRSSPDFPGYRNMLIRQPMDGYIATCVALREADLTADAPQIRVPTLCIVGDQDGSAPPRLVADFAKAIPHSRFEIIKDCGHLPSIEQPGRLVDIMRAFISLAGTEAISHVSH